MADDVELNLGTGGKVIATDEIAGVNHQRVKVQHGADGSATDVSTASPLPVEDTPNVISTVNSTTALLGSGASFIGTAEDISSFAAVAINVEASHDSSAMGMMFEFSSDGTNWDDMFPFTYTAADGARRFQFPASAQFFRVNYTNGGTGQTHFRLQTILHRGSIGTTIHRIDDVLVGDRSAELVRAVIAGEAPGGNFLNVGVSAGGNFKMDLEDIAGVAISVNTGVRDAGTQRITIATDDVVGVVAASLPLPTGAATAAGQLPDGHNVTVDNASLVVDGSGVTQPVSAVALPLPTGAATAAGQLADGHNVTVDNTVGAPANVQIGDGVETAGVTVAGALSVDGSAVTQPVSAVALPLPTGAATAAGQLPDDHNVTVTSLPLPTGAATSAAQLADNHQVVANPGTGDFNLAIAHTRNEAFKESAAIGGELDDTTTVVATEGNVSPARITAQRALHANLRDNAGTEIGTAGAPVRTDPTGTTIQPVSAASLPLPTGAATAASQLADGHNVTVDNVAASAVNCTVVDAAGNSAMDEANDALRVNIVAGSGSGTEFNEDDPSAGGEAGPAILGVRQDADTSPVDTDGDFQNLIFDAAGNLKVNVKLGGGTGGTSSAFAAAFPGTGTAVGWDDGTNMQGARVFDADSGGGSEYVAGMLLRTPASGGSLAAAFGTGARAAGVLRVTVATDDLVPISAASLPLPAGAATSALQLANGHDVTVDNTIAAPANVQISDGTETALVTAAGALEVDGSAVTQPVSAAALPLPSGAATSAGQLADGHNVTADAGTGDFLSIAAHTINEAFKEANAVGGQFDDTTTTVATEDNIAPVRITAQRAFHTNLRNVAGTEIATAADPLRTDPTGSTTQPVSAASLPLPAGAATSAGQLANGHDVTVDNTVGAPANVQLSDGTDTAEISAGGALLTDGSATTQPVSATSLPLPSGAATSAAQLAAGHTVAPIGSAAHDAPIAGNPVPVALRANANEPTAVADADATFAWADLQGRQVVVLDHPAALAAATQGPDNTNVTASGDTALVAAPGASLSIYVTNFWISNNGAAKIKAALRDATTTRWAGTLAADGGGVTGKFDPPWKLAANAALNGNLGAAGDVDFNIQFYVSA